MFSVVLFVFEQMSNQIFLVEQMDLLGDELWFFMSKIQVDRFASGFCLIKNNKKKKLPTFGLILKINKI